MDKKYAIFDMDGTLIDSMVFWKNLATEYLTSKGILQIPADILEQIKPMTMSESAALFRREFGLTGDVEAQMNAIISVNGSSPAYVYLMIDAMIEAGMVEEARRVYPLRHLNSLNTVGYKELFAYFDGHMDYETAVARIGKNTRVYAKKQLTWMKKDPSIHFLNPENALEQVMALVDKQ